MMDDGDFRKNEHIRNILFRGMPYLVKKVIDTNTIMVASTWVFDDQMGNVIKLKGLYRSDEESRKRLESQILNKYITIKEIQGVAEGCLITDAYFKGVHLNVLKKNTLF